MTDVDSNLNKQDLVVREELDIERTALANERTFLAVTRTCFTVLVGAVSLAKFIENPVIKLMGGLFTLASLVGFAAGWVSYHQVSRQIKKEADKLPLLDKEKKLF